MKRTLKIARTLIITFAIGSGTFLVYRTINQLLIPAEIVLLSETQLSQKGHELIYTFINEEINYKYKPLHEIAYLVKNQFSEIKNISITHIPKKLIIKFNIHKPRFVINDKKIFLESGIIKPKHFFDKNSIELLPKLSLNESLHSNKQFLNTCYSYLENISPELFENYDLIWKTEQEIWLTNKEQPRFSILSDPNSINNNQKLTLCSKLKKNIESKKTFSFTKSVWFADIRFDNQVIIFSRGGKGYGYNTYT